MEVYSITDAKAKSDIFKKHRNNKKKHKNIDQVQNQCWGASNARISHLSDNISLSVLLSQTPKRTPKKKDSL